MSYNCNAVLVRASARSVALRLIRGAPFKGGSDPRLARARVLSVDAFDTLITRPLLRPSDVFALCALTLRRQGIIDLVPSAWRDLRHKVETEITRQAHPREVRLDDIYQALVQRGALTSGNMPVAIDIERATERRLCRPIAANIATVNQYVATGGTVLVLSDTYLPQQDVAGMLRQIGLDVPSDAIHTSSQSGHTKRAGALFGCVLGLLGLPVKSTMHVGDNLGVDVRRARSAGLVAAPYLDSKPNRYEQTLLTAPDLLGSIVGGSARATRLSRALPSPHQQTVWNVSADVTGPLLFAFVAWTLREAKRHGLRTLYFFARDGEILLRVARKLQPTLVPGLECRYLHVSRRSLHLPGLVALGPEEREWIMDNAHVHGLAYWLRRLDIGVDEFSTLLPTDSPLRTLNPDERLNAPAIALLEATLDTPAVRNLILSRAAAVRVECLAYMKAQGVTAPGPIGVVDVGWKGRLQRSLCRAVSTHQPDFAQRLYGFYLDLDGMPAAAGQLDVFSALCPDQGFSWARRGSLFEIFCAAHHGTVTGYRAGEPVLATPCNPEAEAWGVGLQQTAVVTFVQEVMQGFISAGLDPLEHLAPLAVAARQVVQLLVVRPQYPEAAAYGSFIHSSDEQHGVYEQIAELINFHPAALLKRLGPAYRSRRISIWPEASLSRSLPGWLRTLALTTLQALPGRHG